MMRIAVVGIAVVLCGTSASRANNPPNTPIITEPSHDGQVVNPGDVHMETGPFSDPDPGDTHRCSDWEIWTISPVERVWVTSCIGGVERLHTHLGDGVFENSYAGRHELFPLTQYRLRVRHRDSSNDPATEWSQWAERLFQTAALSQVFPLLSDDVGDVPAPTWVDPTGLPVVLPMGSVQPFVRLESPAADLLLELRGRDGASNDIVNPVGLGVHVPVRVRMSAGDLSVPLVLPETNLAFSETTGESYVVYLPSMSVLPGQDVYFWVASDGATYIADAGQAAPVFTQLARGSAVPWAVRQPGFKVEIVSEGFQLPVNIAFVPNPGPGPDAPMYYVTELYGAIKVVTRSGEVRDYATGLLNFNPTGVFPGSGEQGLTGLVVNPANGDVYAGMLYSTDPSNDAAPHYPKIVRFTSNDGGLTSATQTIILNMVGETQGQSHQISNFSFGPDGKLYVHMGDGFTTAAAQNLDSFRGKILRLNSDGTAPSDNPFYAGPTITARDYVFAYGLRNPFGGAWRASDASHYELENGPSVDRVARVVRGRNYLWDGSDQSMSNYAIYNWNPAAGPVNLAFVQPETFGGSQFPADRQGHMFASESGPTWGTGPQTLGKRISEFVLDAGGNRVSGPTPLIEYAGSGKASVVGLTAGPDGLYFTDLYKDQDYLTPIDRGAHILRVRFVGVADFTGAPTSGAAPLSVAFTDTSSVPSPTAWTWDFGDGATSAERNPIHSYSDDGVYTVRLSVVGSAGLSVQEKQGFIHVGASPRVAVIGGTLPPGLADQAIGDELRARGFAVTALDDDPANRPTAIQIAAMYDLVVVSSTVASGNIGAEFRTVNIPMIFWENGLLRTGRESLTDNGAVVGGATSVTITDNTHPITSGFPLGSMEVFSPGANMSVSTGQGGPGTRVLAIRSGSTDGAIVAAEAGAVVAGGYTTPARRVFLFYEDSSWLNATNVGRQVLDRAVCWAMNLTAPTITTQPQDTRACPGGSATFSVDVQSGAPVAYAWRRNGQPIAGATHRTLEIHGVTPAQTGTYTVVVSGPCASTTSAGAALTLCAADFNCDGGVNSQDFFDYLAAFFAGSPEADFDHDGTVNSQDFFGFVGAFFAGCG